MRRTQPSTKKAKISSTTRVQLLQWLHGKQQQQRTFTHIVYWRVYWKTDCYLCHSPHFLKTVATDQLRPIVYQLTKMQAFRYQFCGSGGSKMRIRINFFTSKLIHIFIRFQGLQKTGSGSTLFSVYKVKWIKNLINA